MLKRILVPLDGSVTAETILPEVRRLIRGRDTELVFVQAANPIPVEAHTAVFDASLAAAEQYLQGVKEKPLFQGFPVRTIARLGLPIDVILKAAQEEKPDLIAMATHGRTGLSRLLLGSTAEQVVRESPVPVLALRPFWTVELAPPVRTEERPIKTILLPLDGSPESEAAVPEVIRFARTFRARTLLLSVVAPGTEVESEAYREAEAYLREAAKRLDDQGVAAHVLIDTGDPDTVIGDVARFHHVDLLAMATHGRSGMRRILMGSVTERVLRHARVPMLIVRSAEKVGHDTVSSAARPND